MYCIDTQTLSVWSKFLCLWVICGILKILHIHCILLLLMRYALHDLIVIVYVCGCYSNNTSNSNSIFLYMCVCVCLYCQTVCVSVKWVSLWFHCKHFSWIACYSLLPKNVIIIVERMREHLIRLIIRWSII